LEKAKLGGGGNRGRGSRNVEKGRKVSGGLEAPTWGRSSKRGQRSELQEDVGHRKGARLGGCHAKKNVKGCEKKKAGGVPGRRPMGGRGPGGG